MSLELAQALPAGTLYRRGENGLEENSTASLFAGRTVVVFAVPGAFTPTCSDEHLPGFIVNADALKAAGVDEIVCLAVNDPFVMRAWAQQHAGTETISFLSDGNGDWTTLLGMQRDMRKAAMGMRSKRYAMLVNDGVLTWLGVDESGLANSRAEAVLAALNA
ncbi:MAG: peroxiredoxin [Pseudomonadota bacterium]